MKKTLEQRFWAKVDKTDDCWLWSGSKSGLYGHGEIGRGRRTEGKVKTHRLSWELHNGSIPKGMHVLHKCDNGLCVNPDHLFLGTQKDNMVDMAKKGRNRNQNSGKLVCKRGHWLFDDNLVIKAGSRQCRTCIRIRDRQYRLTRSVA